MFRHLFTLLSATVLILFVSASSAQALTSKQIFGIGDQDNFSIYQSNEFNQMDIRASRYLIRWQAVTEPGWQRDQADRWYAAVTAKPGVRPLLSFGGLNDKTYPSPAQYERMVQTAMQRWPLIKEYQAWNEANHATQPATFKNPARAARYAKILDRHCKKGCTAVPITVVLYGNPATQEKWIKRFLKVYGKNPKVWGIHNYGDANRYTDRHLKYFLARHKKGQVWITEAAGWAQFATTWKWDLNRQAKATRFVFRQATKYNSRVKRLYWYEWDGSPQSLNVRWDSALFNADGTPRPAWNVALKERYKRK